jgi:hypothetical protein
MLWVWVLVTSGLGRAVRGSIARNTATRGAGLQKGICLIRRASLTLFVKGLAVSSSVLEDARMYRGHLHSHSRTRSPVGDWLVPACFLT